MGGMKWTKEKTEVLAALVSKHGNNWPAIAQEFNSMVGEQRTVRSVEKRWMDGVVGRHTPEAIAWRASLRDAKTQAHLAQDRQSREPRRAWEPREDAMILACVTRDTLLAPSRASGSLSLDQISNAARVLADAGYDDRSLLAISKRLFRLRDRGAVAGARYAKDTGGKTVVVVGAAAMLQRMAPPLVKPAHATTPPPAQLPLVPDVQPTAAPTDSLGYFGTSPSERSMVVAFVAMLRERRMDRVGLAIATVLNAKEYDARAEVAA